MLWWESSANNRIAAPRVAPEKPRPWRLALRPYIGGALREGRLAEKPANLYRFDSDLVAKHREDLRDESVDALEEVHDSNLYEARYAFQLIELGAIEPNVFGSSEWLAEVQERFK